MDNWTILLKELAYYGIKPLNILTCQVIDKEGTIHTQNIKKTIKLLKKDIHEQKGVMHSLWNELSSILQEQGVEDPIISEVSKKLFIHSLKDMTKFLDCFEELDNSTFVQSVQNALNRDIQSFTLQQISKVPDYKISIDWVHRTICKLNYIKTMLSLISMGKKNVLKNEIKTARGISGPWANLDLPMEERAFPFGFELQQRGRDKRRQRRYWKGFENYNGPNVGEGHYWRELRNEPYSWADRKDEDPYPYRNLLN